MIVSLGVPVFRVFTVSMIGVKKYGYLSEAFSHLNSFQIYSGIRSDVKQKIRITVILLTKHLMNLLYSSQR